MRKLITTFISLGLLLCATAVPADSTPTTLEALSAKLAAIQVLHGQFSQQKTLSDLPVPLNSTGDFVYLQDQGMQWFTRQPVQSVVKLVPSGVILDGRAAPQSEQLGQIFLALFNLEPAALQGYFNLRFQPADSTNQDATEQWQLILQPNTSALQQQVSEIRVYGQDLIQRLELLEANGDHSLIQFSNLQTAATATAEQRAIFE